MAPRKKAQKKPAAVKKTRAVKIANSKMKTAKPQAKPGVVKLKIPVSSSKTKKTMRPKTEKPIKPASPIVRKNKLTTQAQLMLANEVANAQLIKKELPSEDTPPEYVITITRAEPTPPVSKKRSRRANEPVKEEAVKSEVTTSTVTSTGSEDAFELQPIKRKYVRKTQKKTPDVPPKQVKPTRTVKSKAPAETKPDEVLLSPRQKTLKQTKLTDANNGITAAPIKNNDHVLSAPKNVARRNKKNTIGKLGNETTSTELKTPPSQEQSEPKINSNTFTSPKILSPIKSRQTSFEDVSDCFSWTKDISCSSPTTCISASSNDFVRFNKKLPIVKIRNVNCKPTVTLDQDDEDDDDSSSDSSSSSSSGFTPRTPERETTPEIETRSLNLSVSSILSPKSTPQVNRDERDSSKQSTETDPLLNKAAKTHKNFDLEFINWMGYDKTAIVSNSFKFDELAKKFKEESDIAFLCQCLRETLNPDSPVEKPVNDADFVIPGNVCRTVSIDRRRTSTAFDSNNSGRDRNTNVVEKQSVVAEPTDNRGRNYDDYPSSAKTLQDEGDIYSNKYSFERAKHTSLLDHEDDDTLSLFAESLTGLESSKMSVVTASAANSDSETEEYIPQPVTKEKGKSPGYISYVPSKITANDEVQNQDLKRTICEKQNADSTSISKEVQKVQFVPSFSHLESNVNGVPENNIDDSSHNNKWVVPNMRKAPLLVSSLYKAAQGIKSVVFKGYCFYNLISGCKNTVCRFPHVPTIPTDEMKNKLMRLSEDVFIQEYMLIRNWPILRRKYGTMYVEECKRRDLTRLLVEMAIDFHMKANISFREDTAAKVEVIELVLLYLNNINLELCKELLLYSVEKGMLLCDVFMESIADTQNFSRFKKVFINLTDFMVDNQRTFNSGVAVHLLERLCILPFEQSLSKALLKIIENTDSAIFDNSVMKDFEKQLLNQDRGLYQQLLELRSSRKVVGNVERPPPVLEPEVTMKPLAHDERTKRYTSPDTTNLDNMNKALDELAISRTVDLNRQQVIVQRTVSTSSNSNDSTEDRDQTISQPVPDYRSWRGQSVFHKMRASPLNHLRQFRGVRRQLSQQDHSFGHSPPTYPRRHGGDFS